MVVVIGTKRVGQCNLDRCKELLKGAKHIRDDFCIEQKSSFLCPAIKCTTVKDISSIIVNYNKVARNIKFKQRIGYMTKQLQYSTTIKTLPYLYIEAIKAGRLLLEGHNEDAIMEMSMQDNIFQLKTEVRKKAIAATVLNRLGMLDSNLLDQLINGSSETSKQLVIYTIMKTDRLFFEFMNEVYKDKLVLSDPYITGADFKILFQKKAEQSEKIAGWQDYTFYKLQQVYTRILFEAGMVKKGKARLEILRPIIAPEVVTHMHHLGEGLYANVLLGVY